MRINQNGSPYIERYYIAGGQYERDLLPNGQWRNLTYIPTPSGQMALYIQNETTNEADLFFLHTDYQGSIMAIADFEGEIIEEYSYDPWGNRRNPENWQNIYTNTDLPSFTDGEATSLWGAGGILYRGYTFHEHLDCFALINMNGRMYDPVTGRMLSPDNYVQDPSYSQNFNRYSYVYNNPLKYTDPSGEIIFTTLAIVTGQLWALPMAIGADVGLGMYAGGASANNWQLNPAQWDWSSGNTYMGMIAGGIIAGVSAYGITLAAGVGGAGLSVAAKKSIIGGTFSGNLNMIMNYDSETGLGLNSLAYFGAGFAGGFVGVDVSHGMGIVTGGITNVFAGLAVGEVTDGYSALQHFAGGGLSAYAGASFVKATSKPITASYIKKNAYKIYAKYGLQANLSDFAYDDYRTFFEKDLNYHFSVFNVGGIGGLLQAHSMTNPLIYGLNKGVLKSSIGFGLSAVGYGIEFSMSALVKGNYQSYYTGGYQKKITALGYKALIYSLMLQ